MDLFLSEILYPILQSLESKKNAFCIKKTFYSYKQLKQCVLNIRESIRTFNDELPFVGVVVNDDIETYASILALWLEGKAYVPLHESMPIERCEEIVQQVGISYILNSSEFPTRYKNFQVIATSNLTKVANKALSPITVEDSNIGYILFTSGSTGKPKGVPITRANIASFVSAFWNLGYKVDETDRFLQAFDLTFDLSVMSYLIPLLRGACIYTVPHDLIKYSYIAELLEDEKITFALMVPSTIRYLRPYFDEISLPYLKYSLFCGEALPLDITQEWSKCTPNAIIYNVYGPTENTIFCSCYRYSRKGNNKHNNGSLSIGKPMLGGVMEIFNEVDKIASIGESGELCLAGVQLTLGYWNDPMKNSEAFFYHNGTLYYKSGDICTKDQDGDFLYIGRIDSQIKIQGFRVELGEIEYHANQSLFGKNTVAIGYLNRFGTNEIALFIEDCEKSTVDLEQYLHSKLPPYMIPSCYHFVCKFPLNINGKIDRKKLKLMLS